MIYTIYQITNLVNQKFYIGVHKTNNPDDSYMGSGRAIKNAIKKYGKENFKKEVIFLFKNKEDAFKKEQELVDLDFISTSETYNGKLGGCGGWDHVRSPEVQKLAVENLRKFYQTEEGAKNKIKMSEIHKGKKLRPGKWTLTDKHKDNIRQMRRNSLWITNGIIDKAIPKTDKLPEGWKYGRSKTNAANHPNICKNYTLFMNNEKIEIKNLKNWCEENNLNYANIFNCIDKGVIKSTSKYQSESRKWMIGKEIRST